MAKLNFDKFIEDICNREKSNQENLKKMTEEKEELPQRRYNRLYREAWQNSIRFVSRDGKKK